MKSVFVGIVCFIFMVISCGYKVDAQLEEGYFLSESDKEWLLETTQSKFKIGYPSSITPLNYYYFYSSLKGVIPDIFQEFSDLSSKNIASYLVSDSKENKHLMDYNIIDAFVSGKKSEYDEFYYSSPIHEFEYSFYVSQYSKAKNMTDLMNYKIGIVDNDDKIWTYLSDFKEIKTYPNYISLYNGLAEDEIEAVFVPDDLFRYHNLANGLREIKSAEYFSSEWYFISKKSQLISVLDKIMDKMQTMERYADHFFNHQNALISKLYNLDKKTYEWLFYKQPVMKVGIYEAPPFMYYNEDRDELSGMLDHILKQIHTNFGIEFEFLYGSYDDLKRAYQAGEIDILPIFDMELNNKSSLDGEYYQVYQGQINAYGQFNQVMVNDSLEINPNTVFGSITREGLFKQDLNIRLGRSISVLHQELLEDRIDYLVLDPIYLDYFEHYHISYKGKIGKYIFSLVVKKDDYFIKLFDAIQSYDFEDEETLSKYATALSSEMYLYEMSSLKKDLYSMHQQRFVFVGGIFLAGFVILILARLRYLDKKTEYLKYTDYATGLLNRLGYVNKMNELTASKKPFIFMMMDIDHFKLINDTHGHLVGDQVIAQMADVLKKCCPKDSVICRLGGDEFVVCLMDHHEDVAISIVESIQTCLREAVNSLKVTTSIGIFVNDGEITDLEKIYQQADHALYESKKNGRDQYTIFKIK